MTITQKPDSRNQAKENVDAVFERKCNRDLETRYGGSPPLWNTFPPGIVEHDVMKYSTGLAILIFIWGSESTFGGAAELSIREISAGTGLSRSTVYDAIQKRLIKQWGLIYARPGTKFTRYFFVPQNIRHKHGPSNQQREFAFMDRFDHYRDEQGQINFDIEPDTSPDTLDNPGTALEAADKEPSPNLYTVSDAQPDTSRPDVLRDITHAHTSTLIPDPSLSSLRKTKTHAPTGAGDVCIKSPSASGEREGKGREVVSGGKRRGKRLSDAERFVYDSFKEIWDDERDDPCRIEGPDFNRIRQLAADYGQDRIGALIYHYLDDDSDYLVENGHPLEALNPRNQSKYNIDIEAELKQVQRTRQRREDDERFARMDRLGVEWVAFIRLARRFKRVRFERENRTADERKALVECYAEFDAMIAEHREMKRVQKLKKAVGAVADIIAGKVSEAALPEILSDALRWMEFKDSNAERLMTAAVTFDPDEGDYKTSRIAFQVHMLKDPEPAVV